MDGSELGSVSSSAIFINDARQVVHNHTELFPSVCFLSTGLHICMLYSPVQGSQPVVYATLSGIAALLNDYIGLKH